MKHNLVLVQKCMLSTQHVKVTSNVKMNKGRLLKNHNIVLMYMYLIYLYYNIIVNLCFEQGGEKWSSTV